MNTDKTDYTALACGLKTKRARLPGPLSLFVRQEMAYDNAIVLAYLFGIVLSFSAVAHGHIYAISWLGVVFVGFTAGFVIRNKRKSWISRLGTAFGEETFDLKQLAILSLGQQEKLVCTRLCKLATNLRLKEQEYLSKYPEPEHQARITAKTEFEVAYKAFLEAGYISNHGFGPYFDGANKPLKEEKEPVAT